MSSSHLEDRSCLVLVRRMHKHSNEWYDPIWLEVFQDIWWHHSLCHPAGGYGCYDIAYYVVLITLLCERLGETDLREFGGGVVALTEASEQACSRRCVDNPAILLLPEMWPRSSGTLGQVALAVNQKRFEDETYFVRALYMNLDDEIPVVIRHILKADIS